MSACRQSHGGCAKASDTDNDTSNGPCAQETLHARCQVATTAHRFFQNWLAASDAAGVQNSAVDAAAMSVPRDVTNHVRACSARCWPDGEEDGLQYFYKLLLPRVESLSCKVTRQRSPGKPSFTRQALCHPRDERLLRREPASRRLRAQPWPLVWQARCDAGCRNHGVGPRMFEHCPTCDHILRRLCWQRWFGEDFARQGARLLDRALLLLLLESLGLVPTIFLGHCFFLAGVDELRLLLSPYRGTPPPVASARQRVPPLPSLSLWTRSTSCVHRLAVLLRSDAQPQEIQGSFIAQRRCHR